MTSRRLCFEGRPEEVHHLLDWLDNALGDSDLDEAHAFMLRCVTVEIVNNTIAHAYRDRAGEPVDVRLELTPGHVVIEIWDLGAPFDGFSAEAPSDPLAESGRGSEIVQAWADTVTFFRSEPWNVCRIEKTLSA